METLNGLANISTICIGKIINRDIFDRVMTEYENKNVTRSVITATGKEILVNLKEYFPELGWQYANVNKSKESYSQYKDDIFTVYIGYSNGHCGRDKNEELENCKNTVCIDVKTYVNFFKKLFSV